MTDKKPRGYFKRLLAIDTETSGYHKEQFRYAGPADRSSHYQMVSIGLIVTEFGVFKPIEKLYLEIKWNGESLWDLGAQKVHGLSKEYLEEHGISEEEAAIQIFSFISKHFGPDCHLTCLGHNVPFDICFLLDLAQRFGIDIRFAGRHIDTNAVGMATVGSFNSDDFFSELGLPERTLHNSLEDCEHALEATRRVNKLWKQGVKMLETQ